MMPIAIAGLPIGVAASGGADSLCLLRMLPELAPRWDLLLGMLHVGPWLGGEESRREAEFVRELAEGLPCLAEASIQKLVT